MDNNPNIMGQVVYAQSTIKLRKDLSPTRLASTLYHEVVHAMLYEAGFEDHEEPLVNALGSILQRMVATKQFDKIATYPVEE